MPLRPLAFVHIPKTAGTTMHKILTQQYPRNRTRLTSDPSDPFLKENQKACEKGSGRQIDLVLGHCPVGVHEIIPDVSYISCVRDPVKRIISHYHYARQSPAHYLYEKINKDGFTLKDYAEYEESSELSNGMVRLLCGRPDFRECKISQEIYDSTLKIIESRFKFIATTERFDESLLVLRKIIKISTPYYVRRKVGNYSQKKDSVSPEAIATIKERNQFDQLLYDKVNHKLDEESASLGITPLDVESFQKKNKRFGKGIFILREMRSRLQSGKVIDESRLST